jgi:AbrB family looped-hinge helix DNA binding protein
MVPLRAGDFGQWRLAVPTGTIPVYAQSITGSTLTANEKRMRITSKGQVTIPQEIREKLGLLPNTEVEFVIEGRSVRIVKTRSRRSRGDEVVRRLRGRASVAMTTEEILALTRKRA